MRSTIIICVLLVVSAGVLFITRDTSQVEPIEVRRLICIIPGAEDKAFATNVSFVSFYGGATSYIKEGETIEHYMSSAIPCFTANVEKET